LIRLLVKISHDNNHKYVSAGILNYSYLQRILLENKDSFLKRFYTTYFALNISRQSSAIAYYTIFSLSPLLLILVSIAGLIYSKDAVTGRLYREMSGTIGSDSAAFIQSMISKSGDTSTGVVSSIISLVLILVGASGVLGALQESLDLIWQTEDSARSSWKLFIKNRFLSLATVLALGFFFLVSLVVSAALAAFSEYTLSHLSGLEGLMWIFDLLISFSVNVILFSCLYIILPSTRVAFKEALLGACTASVLFLIGKYIIGLYLGTAGFSSTFGAAGAFVVILVWVYYSAQIILIGALFSREFAGKEKDQRITRQDSNSLAD
jgi:membrane protein